MQKLFLLIVSLFLVLFLKAQNTNYGTNAGNLGDKNTNLGYLAGDVVTGNLNTFVGYMTGKTTTLGVSNTIIGSNAGFYNTTGGYNTFNGCMAGYYNTIGIANAFFGYSAGVQNTEGNYNLFGGSYSGNSNTKGSNNVCLGFYAGYANTLGNSNIFLGFMAGYNETGSNKLYIDNSSTSTPLIYGDFSTDMIVINGNLGIGTSKPDEKLTVKGKIHAEEVIIDFKILADYVFENNYQLMKLSDVEKYVLNNKHLPGIPSGKEVIENGLNIGIMQNKLLEKVEELTLHAIELEKKNAQLEKEMKELKELVMQKIK